MAALRNKNSSPRFAEYCAQHTLFGSKPLVVFDVGARGGFASYWNIFKDQELLVGFEADAEDCRLMRDTYGDARHLFYPVILGRAKESKKLYNTEYAPSAGLYEPDITYLGRFLNGSEMRVAGTAEVETIDLDSFLASEQFAHTIDFLKVDVEGADLDVLEGAEHALEHVLGVSVEAEFLPVHKGQAVFSDIDMFLRKTGFSLYDMTLYRNPRACLPDMNKARHPNPTRKGQVALAQALYFRDPIADTLRSPDSEAGRWNKTRILKLASLFEIFSLNDCAAELIDHFSGRGMFAESDANRYRDLLVPPVRGKFLHYHEYLALRDFFLAHGYFDGIGRLQKFGRLAKSFGVRILPSRVRASAKQVVSRFL